MYCSYDGVSIAGPHMMRGGMNSGPRGPPRGRGKYSSILEWKLVVLKSKLIILSTWIRL